MSIIIKKVEMLQKDKKYVEEENIELKRKINNEIDKSLSLKSQLKEMNEEASMSGPASSGKFY